MLLKLNFEVLYRRILFVMGFVYYFGHQNRGIPRETASILYQGAGKRPADLSDWQKCPRPEGPGAPAALGPKGRGLLSTLTKIVRTIHNHLYMKIIRSLHFCKFASAHYIKIQRNRKMSIFRFSFGD